MDHNYEGFYESHIQERLDYQYPSYFKLIKLNFRHEDVEVVKKSAFYFAAKLHDIFGHRVLGPEFPVIARIRGKYSMNILLKFERAHQNISESKQILMKEVDIYRSDKEYNKVRLNVDVDPY
jgi:primosomal protein N' (replication factor Y)